MKIIAHRGASGDYPENTLLAFDQAISEGCDGIEFDVFYHHSGSFVVLHNRYVDKTTAASGYYNDFSLAELQRLDTGQGQFIPTLDQTLECIIQAIAKYGSVHLSEFIFNIEFKTSTTVKSDLHLEMHALNKLISTFIHTHNISFSQFIISSFNHRLLFETKSLIPEISIGALTSSIPLTYAKFAQNLQALTIHPCYDCLDQAYINDAHARGLHVYVYTVDKPYEIKRCLHMGVDAIFTNYPKKSRLIIKNFITQL
jgi:glycerophosphoryl diester phosphodiesterase